MTVSMLFDNMSSREMSLWNQYYKVKAVEAEMRKNKRR